MNKQYMYNGKSYSLKPVTLGVMKDIMPLLIRLRKLVYKYTSDIDMTAVNKIRTKITELEKARQQLSGQIENELQNDERISVINRINLLNEKIDQYKTELENDNELSNRLRLYNECSSMAVIELFSDEELISRVLASIITIDAGIDINNPEGIKFISEVLTDFFLLIRNAGAG